MPNCPRIEGCNFGLASTWARCRELGVRYVLEGSVRKAGDRIRITAQLADAATGHHVWAERYDRELDDVFALQDEIVARIVAELVQTFRRRGKSREALTRSLRITRNALGGLLGTAP